MLLEKREVVAQHQWSSGHYDPNWIQCDVIVDGVRYALTTDGAYNRHCPDCPPVWATKKGYSGMRKLPSSVVENAEAISKQFSQMKVGESKEL